MHKLILTALTPAIVTATLLTTAARADDDNKPKIAAASSFAALDRNGDHRISRSEAGFDRVLTHTFAEIDADGDGFVSATEFAAAEKTRATVTNVNSR